MDNNNQSPQNEESEEMTIPPVKNFDPKLFAAVVVLILVIVGIVITMLGKTQNTEPIVDTVSPATPEVVVPAIETGPEKVSAGEALPEGFPKDTLGEPTSELDQSYTIKYPEGEQSTVVFTTNQELKKEYDLYLAQLKKEAWIIVSTKETAKISSIYAMKDNREINITLMKLDEVNIEVSISTFNK